LKRIADFRDPWTEISYYQHLKLTQKSDKKHRDLETLVFKNADITIATSYTDAENFKKKGANSVCITNGFDIEIKANSKLKTKKFTLSYIGVLEQLRNPEILWTVLNELVAENLDFANHFELKFVGKLDDKILGQIQNSGLKDNLNYKGYLSHQESLVEMNDSDLLLITNFPNESSSGIIPGKLFEYLATGCSIVSFGPKTADVQLILDKTHAGKHFDYSENKEVIKQFLLSKFNDWKQNSNTKNNTNLEEFSRRNLTQVLVQFLNSSL
jgi:glycosyltransferase involved in cell wall biosynthesis